MVNIFEFKHRYVPSVEQVKFSHWSDKKAPKEYWSIIGSIACFIGNGLNGQLRFGKRRNVWSTIWVVQTKEKFGNAVVYCNLAEPSLVELDWEGSPDFQHGIIVPHSFKHHAQLRDAQHYRHIYLMAMEAWPQYYTSIRAGAEFPGLLCHSKDEFDELCDSPFHSNCGFCIDTPEERADLYKICGW